MPTADEWAAEGLQNYGLIAVNDKGQAAQVEKVTHETATRLLQDGLGQDEPGWNKFRIFLAFPLCF